MISVEQSDSGAQNEEREKCSLPTAMGTGSSVPTNEPTVDSSNPIEPNMQAEGQGSDKSPRNEVVAAEEPTGVNTNEMEEKAFNVGNMASEHSSAAAISINEHPSPESGVSEEWDGSDENDSTSDDGLDDEASEKLLRGSKLHQLLCMIAPLDGAADGVDVSFSYGYLFPTGRQAFAEELSNADKNGALKSVIAKLGKVLAKKLNESTKLLCDHSGGVKAAEAIVIAVALKEIDRGGHAPRLRLSPVIDRFIALCEVSPALKEMAIKEGLIEGNPTPPPHVPEAAKSYIEEMEVLLGVMSCKRSRFNTKRIEELADRKLDSNTSVIFPLGMFQRAADLLPMACDLNNPPDRRAYLRLMKRYFLHVEDVDAAMEIVYNLSLFQESRYVELRRKLHEYYEKFYDEVDRAIRNTCNPPPNTLLTKNSTTLRRIAFLLALFPEATMSKFIGHICKNRDKLRDFMKVFRILPAFFRLRVPLHSRYVKSEKELVVVSMLRKMLSSEPKVLAMDREEDLSFLLKFITVLTRRKLSTGLLSMNVEVEERELVDATDLVNDFVVEHLKQSSQLLFMIRLMTRLFGGSLPNKEAYKWVIEWKGDEDGGGDSRSSKSVVDQSMLLGLLADLYCREADAKLKPLFHSLFHAFAAKLRACGARITDFDGIMEALGINDWKRRYCLGTWMKIPWGSDYCRPARVPHHLYNCLSSAHKERFEPFDNGDDGGAIGDFAKSLASLVELAMVSGDMATKFRGMIDFSTNMCEEGIDDALAVLAEAFSQQLLAHRTVATCEVIDEKFVPLGHLLCAVTSNSPAREPYAKSIDDGSVSAQAKMRSLAPLRLFGETALRLLDERERMKAAFNTSTFDKVLGRDTDDDEDDEYEGQSTSTRGARISCWTCGDAKHKRGECTYAQKTCWLCGREGHKALVCMRSPCKKCRKYHPPSNCTASNHTCTRCRRRGHVESLCDMFNQQQVGEICGGCFDRRYHRRSYCRSLSGMVECRDCKRRGHLAKTPICEALSELYSRYEQGEKTMAVCDAEKEKDRTKPPSIDEIEALIGSLLKIFCQTLSTHAVDFEKKASLATRTESGMRLAYAELGALQLCCNLVRGLIHDLIANLTKADLSRRLDELRNLLTQFDNYGLQILETLGPKPRYETKTTHAENWTYGKPPSAIHHGVPRMAQRPSMVPIPFPPPPLQQLPPLMMGQYVQNGPPLQASGTVGGQRPQSINLRNIVEAHVNSGSHGENGHSVNSTSNAKPGGDGAGHREKGKKGRGRMWLNSNSQGTSALVVSVVQAAACAGGSASQDSNDPVGNAMDDRDGTEKGRSVVGEGEKENDHSAASSSTPPTPSAPAPRTNQKMDGTRAKKTKPGSQAYKPQRMEENPRPSHEKKSHKPYKPHSLSVCNSVPINGNRELLGTAAAQLIESANTQQQEGHVALNGAVQPMGEQREDGLFSTDQNAETDKVEKIRNAARESSMQVIAEDKETEETEESSDAENE